MALAVVVSLGIMVPLLLYAIWLLDVFNLPHLITAPRSNYVPEDNVIEDSLPQNVFMIENIKIECNYSYILIIPHYRDEHSVTLKVINFNDDHKIKLPITLNGQSALLNLTTDYETHNLTFPTLTFKKKPYSANPKIPRNIAQTYEYRNVTRRKYLSVRAIIDNNPNFYYRFYDNVTRDNFIRDNFNDYVYRAYQKLIPGTYKADFFRFCFIYIYGGTYMDCKLVALQNFEGMITSGYDMVFAQDVIGPEYY